MQQNALYYLTSLAIILAGGLMHLDYRRRESRARGESLILESTVIKELRRLAVMLAVLAVLLHILRPEMLAWGEVSILPAIRWTGALIAIAGLIGIHVSERALLPLPFKPTVAGTTQSARVTGRLVTTGPYAVVRHPSYMSFAIVALGIALLTGGIIVAALGAVISVHLLAVLVPREEVQLADLFTSSGRPMRTAHRVWCPVYAHRRRQASSKGECEA
ncbi:MAG: hypothetical protein M3Z05_05765 [Gemmatimonadota bacterium]|nr:hypothetical protein [Gemmatimonadota bacterium]